MALALFVGDDCSCHRPLVELTAPPASSLPPTTTTPTTPTTIDAQQCVIHWLQKHPLSRPIQQLRAKYLPPPPSTIPTQRIALPPPPLNLHHVGHPRSHVRLADRRVAHDRHRRAAGGLAGQLRHQHAASTAARGRRGRRARARGANPPAAARRGQRGRAEGLLGDAGVQWGESGQGMRCESGRASWLFFFSPSLFLSLSSLRCDAGRPTEKEERWDEQERGHVRGEARADGLFGRRGERKRGGEILAWHVLCVLEP